MQRSKTYRILPELPTLCDLPVSVLSLCTSNAKRKRELEELEEHPNRCNLLFTTDSLTNDADLGALSPLEEYKKQMQEQQTQMQTQLQEQQTLQEQQEQDDKQTEMQE